MTKTPLKQIHLNLQKTNAVSSSLRQKVIKFEFKGEMVEHEEYKFYYIAATSLLAFILLRYMSDKRDENLKRGKFSSFHLSKFYFFIINLHFCFDCRIFVQGKSFRKSTRCDGKVVVITGGNTGIGLETAVELAKRYIG